MNFKSFSFADLKALTNEMRTRLNDPLYWAYKDKNVDILSNATKEIDKRLDALISPQKSVPALNDNYTEMFLQCFNDITGHSIRKMDDKAKRQTFKLLKEGYIIKIDFTKAIKSAFADMTTRETVKHLTPEFITRPAQFSKYLNMKDEPTKSLYQPA